MKKTRIALGAVATVSILAALVGFLGLTWIDQNETLIVKNDISGKIEENNHAGVSWYNPFTHGTERISIKEHNMKSRQDGTTKDQVQSNFDLNVTWKVTDPLKVFKQLNTNDEPTIFRRINNSISKSADVVANEYSYTDLKGKTAEVNQRLLSNTKDLVSKDFKGVEVLNITINTIDAPASVKEAIANKIARKQEADASAFGKEKAKNEKEAQQIKKSIGKDQQKIEICKSHPNSLYCLPENVQVVGNSLLKDLK